MKQKNYTDEEIVTMILQSDTSRKEALRYLYIEWHASTRSILLKSGATLPDVEDAIQEAVIVLDNSIRCGKYQKMASLKSYFIGICKGRLYSNRRSTKRIDLVDPQQRLDRIDTQHPEVLMLEWEQKALINKMLEMLDEKCKKILMLYRLSYSTKEIGQEIGISNSNTIRQRVFQCRKKMMKLVAKNPLFASYFKNLS